MDLILMFLSKKMIKYECGWVSVEGVVWVC